MAFAGMSLVADGELCASTASLIDARADRGYHLLAVEGYSRSKGTPPSGECIQSRPFLVGGHRWIIKYYPNGCKGDDEEFIRVFLLLDDYVEGLEEVKAMAAVSFIDEPELRMSTRLVRKIQKFDGYNGEVLYIKREILEASRHLKDDSFIIRCDIVVVKEEPGDTTTDKGGMPPSDMQSHLSDLLLSDEGSDITFVVGGETFPAHRCVLAARSSVFKEQLFGDTTATKKDNIVEIDDMEAKIFYALLIFIYTGSFPDWDWIEDAYEEGDESGEEEDDNNVDDEYVMWLLQLLEAADRYDLQRLKSMCAEELLHYTDMVDRVADIIVVAEQRQCHSLKDSCVKFIKSHSSLYTALTVDSLDQIIRTCSPSVLKELIFKFAI